MKTVFTFLSFCLYFGTAAQTRCAIVDNTKALPSAISGIILKTSSDQKSIVDTAVIRIPVVVHVLYNNAQQNISDAQIKSGIEALNRDFRRRNADSVNTPSPFKNVAADVQIEFYLAASDPLGWKTTGIVRRQTSRLGWTAEDKMKKSLQGGDDAWDSKSYLNIWVVNLIGGSGYASLPGSAAENDGVVINFSVFGTLNTVAPFNMGRTAVHEVGHWLGLKHIWGDAACGDDGVDDTPTQGFFTKGCPSGFRSSCNSNPAGDMFMNYMDYTDDACMNLFTNGQRKKMRSLFAAGGWRESLLQSRGLSEALAEELALPIASPSIYPNPASDKVTLQTSASLLGKKVLLLNGQGQLQKTILIEASQQIISVASLKPGIYFLKGENFTQRLIKL